MNTEDKQKAMLADDLSAYIKDKHTQEECIGFIDGYNMALAKLKSLKITNDVEQIEQFYCCIEKGKDKDRCETQCLGCAGLQERSINK